MLVSPVLISARLLANQNSAGRQPWLLDQSGVVGRRPGRVLTTFQAAHRLLPELQSDWHFHPSQNVVLVTTADKHHATEALV